MRSLQVAALIALAGCTRGETVDERCRALQPRYRDLIGDWMQEARERVPGNTQDDRLTRLNLDAVARLTEIDRKFVAACRGVDVDRLVRCVDAERVRFARLETDDAALRRALDLATPWIVKPEDAACAPAFAAIEGRLYPRPRPVATETAFLAGGCFWGMEDILRDVPGVVETEVGYMADAETVRVVFDPTRLAYADLLERWYFRMHDPTTPNRQGNDVGRSYRSAIFATSDAQLAIAREVARRVGDSGRWKAPIVTEIVRAGEFTVAGDDHQDYLERNPGGYTCHYLRD